MADRLLSDRYRLEATLGEGGMARVFKGTDQVLGRPVAVKVLADRYAGDDRFVTRFRREASAAAGLNHPNIVSVFDTGDDGRDHYIVMEFVEGETLAHRLRREGALDPDLAGRIAEEVATALQAAHDRGLVHRDVKPGNVMIDPEGRIKVMDFGIARAAADDTLTQTGAVLGTAAYLSPEQARGDRVDARSDLYSLGCVLYEMLGGRPPFTGESPVSIAYRHVNDAPDPPSAHHPGVPPELEAVVMRALEKDPERRYGTADELRAAVAAARGAGVPTAPMAAPGGDTQVMPVAAPPVTVPPPPDRRAVRSGLPRWLPLALVAAAVLALAGILALALAGDEPRRGGGGQRGQGQGGPPAEESPPPEEESPPPDIGTPDEALQAFESVLTAAVAEGAMELGAAQKVADRVDAGAERYAGGDLEGALRELSKAHDEVDKAASKGEVASEETALQIHQGIDVIAASMEAAPPESSSGEGDGEEEDD
jgi:eukaryotic-like serine/threonine-protein kinase